MVSKSGVTGRIIDERHSSDIQGDQLEGVTPIIIDEFNFSDIQQDQIEGESGVTGDIVDELHSGISKDIKWKVKVVLLELSLMNFILGISTRSNAK